MVHFYNFVKGTEFRKTPSCVLISRTKPQTLSFVNMKVLPLSFIACCILVVTTCLPTKRSSQPWPCQRDKDVRTLLSDALSISRNLAGEISVLSNIMNQKWPTDPNKESNVAFFVPTRKINKTTNKPEHILRANRRILRAFILLVNNATKQLERFQVTDGLVISKLEYIKLQTRSLISCLRRIVTVIKSQRQGARSAAPQGNQQRDNEKPATRPLQTATIEDVTSQTKLMLDDFNANVLTLAIDLLKIKGLACN